jgi:hypothetical protein
MSKLPQTVLQKAYLLDPSVESDNPLPVFKSVGEIVSENLTLLLVILSSLIFFLVAWYLLKKKNQQTQEEELSTPTDPFEDAIESIHQLQKQSPRLLPKPFVFKLSEILRIYIERLFRFPAMELTGEEFMREIASHSFFQNRYEDLLREFVERGDRVKYSEESIDGTETDHLLDSALHLVKDIHAKLEEEKKVTESAAKLENPR